MNATSKPFCIFFVDNTGDIILLNNADENNLPAVVFLLPVHCAITTIATVAIKSDGPQNAVAIGGGLLSAGLGALTINAAGKRMTLTHQRNVLKDIWHTPDTSAIYPSFTWYVLTQKHFSNSGQLSLAASIRKRWEQYDLGGPVSAADVQLFFGSGGTYKADDLHTRAAMLNELQSTVRSVNQDLQRFVQYLGSLE
jgi:hypothetical protein